MKNLSNVKKLTREEMRSVMAGKDQGQCVAGCGAYATQQCQDYSQLGQFCYYQFYEDCVAGCTQL